LELEAITATDTGNVGGANLILMGPPELDQRLNMPALARIRQRSRLGQKIAALNSQDVSAYLEHTVRFAGVEAHKLFDDDVAQALFQLSGGVPRVINNICDAALAEAYEQNQNTVTRQLALTVAADVYGLEPVIDESSPIVETQPEPEPVAKPEPKAEPVAQVETVTAPPAPDLPPVVAASLAQEEEEISERADLIDITANQPALKAGVDLPYVPPTVDDALPSAELPEPESFNDTADDLPMLSNSMRIDGPITPAPISDENVVPPIVKTSPVPDLDALEAAITAARGGDAEHDQTDTCLPNLNFEDEIPRTEVEAEAEPELAQNPWPAPDISVNPSPVSNTEIEPLPEPVPVPAPQAEATPQPEPVIETAPEPVIEAEPAPEPEPEPAPELVFEPEPVFDAPPEAPPEPVVDEAPDAVAEEIAEITLDKSIDSSLEDQRAEGNKLDAIAASLDETATLEDLSDMMAETLFGIEFEQIAQEALKNPPAAGTLPGETDVLATDAFESPENSTPANDPGVEPSPVMLESEEPEKTPTVSVPIINALPESEESEPRVGVPGVAPDSIENQFQTEITQTMKTIDPANLPNAELDAEDEKPGGLFGRFKKTFRG